MTATAHTMNRTSEALAAQAQKYGSILPDAPAWSHKDLDQHYEACPTCWMITACDCEK